MTSRRARWARIAAILPMVLLLGRAVAAEEEEVDPPDRVARLSYVQGDVSLSAADGETQRAELNRPLTSGDELDVGNRGRAELEMDVASVHLGEDSSVALLALDDTTLRIRLIDGEMVAHVRELREGDRIEIETANARVSLMEPGEYHLAVEDNGEATIVGVRTGGTEIESGAQVFSLHASQEGRYRGTSPLEEEVRALGPRNELEAWADGREQPHADSESARYVSREVIGYEDLDHYGRWETDSYYGPVWYPSRISMGWAPYRFGSWSYIGPWGWTWIDQAPWGFAPFHYGRWTQLRSRWCWVPGPRHVRPVYAPALVGWVGRGSGYAWFPLGPREVYVPRYRASDRYVRQVNLSNTTIVNVDHITNVYRNRVPPGRYMNERQADRVRAIPRSEFTAQRPPVRFVDRNATREARETRAARPGYQPPLLAPSPRSAPGREWSTGGRPANAPIREVPDRQPGSAVTREIPNREIPRGNIPSYSTAPPPRTVSPPVRSNMPPSRVLERESRSASPMYERRSVSPPPRPVSSPPRSAPPPRSPPPQNSRPDRLDRHNR